ncbi:DUF2339 domain-containing protein [Candidatus Spongiisocius sp.]|uniref:DUF2339 domain-containing protein n=1 Tax=Candidatus Spongiisocius sp. TaxID=3101273 RepID=UPI003B59D819
MFTTNAEDHLAGIIFLGLLLFGGGVVAFVVSLVVASRLGRLSARIEQIDKRLAGFEQTRSLRQEPGVLDRLTMLERRLAAVEKADGGPGDVPEAERAVPGEPVYSRPPAPIPPAGSSSALPPPVESEDVPAESEGRRIEHEPRLVEPVPDEPGAAPSPRPYPAGGAAPTRTAPRADRDRVSEWISGFFGLVKSWFTTGNVPVKVGVIISLLGLGFLLVLAVEQGWITLGVEVRLIAAALFGVALLVVGWRVRTRNAIYGLSLSGGGIAVLYLTTYVAHAVYGLLPPSGAAVAVIVITVVAGVLAVAQDSRSLAVLGIIGGFLAPILAYSDSEDHVVVFGFYTILSVAIVVLARFKVWPELNLLGLGFTVGLTAFWLLTRYETEHWPTTQPLIAVLVLLYMTIPLMSADRRVPDIKDPTMSPLILGLPFVGLGFQYVLTNHFDYGVATSALVLAIVHLAFAVIARRFGRGWLVFQEVSWALAAAFFAIAIPLALDSQYISIVWTVQGAVLVWFGTRRSHNLFTWGGCTLQGFGAVTLVSFVVDALPYSGGRYYSGVLSFLVDNVDFGPVVTSIGLALVYTVLSEAMRRSSGRTGLRHVLSETYLVAGMGLLALAAMLAMDIEYVSAAWVALGLVSVWIGIRQERHPPVWAGSILQLLAGLALAVFLARSLPYTPSTPPVFNNYFLWTVVIMVGGLMTARLLERAEHRIWGDVEPVQIALWWGIGWWLAGGLVEITGQFADVYVTNVALAFVTLSLGGTVLLAPLVKWPRLDSLVLLILPAVGLGFLRSLGDQDHPFANHGWAAWIAALAVYYLVLRRRGSELPGNTVAMHTGGYWILAALLGREVYWQVDRVADGIWPASAALAVLLAGVGVTLWGRDRLWPVRAFRHTYLLACAGPVLLVSAGWLVWLGLSSTADPRPLLYLPVLNPLEALIILCVLPILAWKRLAVTELDDADPGLIGENWAPGFTVAGIALLTMTVARTVHHWAGVPFDFGSMIDSTTLQASLSIVWGLAGLAAMVVGVRLVRRTVWVGGASLMVIVVVKLFVFDLSNTGTVGRVVSFLGVGLLLLVVGYFAPVPPSASARDEALPTGGD